MKKAEKRKYNLQVSGLLSLLVIATVVTLYSLSQANMQTLRSNAAKIISNQDLPQLVMDVSPTTLLASASATPSVTAAPTVAGNQNPTATILTPVENSYYKAGQTISFTGEATDPEDGTLGGSSFKWKVERIVDVAVTAVVQGWTSGSTSGSFQTADTGDPNPETKYRITLLVTDSQGGTTQVTRDVLPTWVRMNFYTEPAGLNLVVDGQTYPAGFYVIDVVGFKREIAAPLTQTINGRSYAFVSWSDGAEAARTIVSPETETTYVVTYQETTAATPTSTPSASPTLTPMPSVMVSPTLSVSSTPAPTGTAAASTRVSVKLALEGLGTTGDSIKPTTAVNAAPIHTHRTVSVNVYGEDNTALLKREGTVVYDEAIGKFAGIVDLGTSLPGGTYMIKLKPDQFLEAQVEGNHTLSKGVTTVLPETRLVNGDVVGDNVLNILDYNVLLSCYTDLQPAAGCTGNNVVVFPDLTDDGFVNQFDYNLFLRELKAKS